MSKVRRVEFVQKDYVKSEQGGFHVFETEKEGVFHGFSHDYEEYEDGIGNFSVAIIEDEDGQVHMIRSDKVKFIKDNCDPLDLSPTNEQKLELYNLLYPTWKKSDDWKIQDMTSWMNGTLSLPFNKITEFIGWVNRVRK